MKRDCVLYSPSPCFLGWVSYGSVPGGSAVNPIVSSAFACRWSVYLGHDECC